MGYLCDDMKKTNKESNGNWTIELILSDIYNYIQSHQVDLVKEFFKPTLNEFEYTEHVFD